MKDHPRYMYVTFCAVAKTENINRKRKKNRSEQDLSLVRSVLQRSPEIDKQKHFYIIQNFPTLWAAKAFRSSQARKRNESKKL